METILVVATLAGGIAALWFFWDKIANWFGGGANVSSHDIDLFEKYKNLFVKNGVAEFYRQHDFLGSFQNEYWRPLSSYVDHWHTVEYEFVDKKLNKDHKKVYSAAEKLGLAIAKYTVPIGKNGYLRSVKPDNLPFGPTPDHIVDEAKRINELVPAFIKAHTTFVKSANSKLFKHGA